MPEPVSDDHPLAERVVVIEAFLPGTGRRERLHSDLVAESRREETRRRTHTLDAPDPNQHDRARQTIRKQQPHGQRDPGLLEPSR